MFRNREFKRNRDLQVTVNISALGFERFEGFIVLNRTGAVEHFGPLPLSSGKGLSGPVANFHRDETLENALSRAALLTAPPPTGLVGGWLERPAG